MSDTYEIKTEKSASGSFNPGQKRKVEKGIEGELRPHQILENSVDPIICRRIWQ